MPFSVLLSLYKEENELYLDDCLSSILINQTLKPNELVIVLDGEITLALENVISKWVIQSPIPFKVIPLPTNVGLGNALNIGLKHCSNIWVFRMDTDDYCSHLRFQKQIEHIHSNDSLALLGSCTEEFNASMNHSISLRKVPCSYNEIKKYLKHRNPFNHMTVAFRKDVIQSVGGYQHHLYMEDYNLWIRVIAAGHQVANLSEALVNVRGGDSMIKRRKGLVYIKSELQLAKLKIEQKIDTPINAYLTFILRSIPRLLPTSILSQVYKNLRK
ncbi:glycosyltransferase [Providencia alcalifaciens]|nr:glycosyltransferase [Providencia alcalifaciens]MTC62075.1 glycosyltransferase [Providencia alcalifaciens]